MKFHDYSRGDMVFDLSSRKTDIQMKKEQAVTWTVEDSDAETASAEHPILVLADPDRELPHHQNGYFEAPSTRTSFVYRRNGQEKSTDVCRIDRRFLKLYGWLGESHMSLRLSGVQTEEGYAVCKVRAVDPTGKTNRVTSQNGLLQLMIERIFASHPAVKDEEPEEDMEESAEEKDVLSDLPSMEDFLACAGDTLPKPVYHWAVRSIQTIKSGTISPEERRHAQRALSIMLNIQWKSSYFAPIDPIEARKILDEELYGLEGVKQRIIETIIQINRTHTLPSYGLLLCGPAGIGKSQLAYAVARILKLPWTSLDMSAIHDSEALTGSPRIYENAKPGRIMEAFSEAGSSNLVFIINELDKADSATASGNPADALLTLLDNLGYTDNYIECTIPTGGVYPIATANDKSRISEPLMTRFAVIDIPDYTPQEKRTIFSEFSLPKVLKRMGMKKEECVIPRDSVDVIVDRFAASSGCRDLEQAAEHLAANALYRIETEHVQGVTFTPEMTRELLNS